MGIQYRKGICSCHNEERIIVKRHPRLGNLCDRGNKARLAGVEIAADGASSEVDDGYKAEAEVFRIIWEGRERVSFLTGDRLEKYTDTSQWYNLFAHVLSKAQNKYPKYRVNPKNIVMLTPHEHGLFDHGTVRQRQKYADETGCDWNKLFEFKEELKNEYKEKHG